MDSRIKNHIRRVFLPVKKVLLLSEDLSCITANIGKYAIIWWNSPSAPNKETAGRIKRVNETPSYKQVVIELMAGGGEVFIPIYSIIRYGVKDSIQELAKEVDEAAMLEISKKGSIIITYQGTVYMSIETILEVNEEFKALSEMHHYSINALVDFIFKIENSPINDAYLNEFLERLGSFLNVVRHMPEREMLRISLTNLVTNIMSALVAASISSSSSNTLKSAKEANITGIKEDRISLKVATTCPPFNYRVTYSKSPKNARSESSIAINPRNPYNIVAGSKKFIDPTKYEFTLAVYSSSDGGITWDESEPLKLQHGWAGLSDPALAWDISQSGSSSTTTTTANGNTTKICTSTTITIDDIVYLVALPFTPNDGPIIGIAIYQSTDGGKTWSSPTLIHKSVDPNSGREDDKQWAVGDNNPSSTFFGNVYAVWDDGPGVGDSKLAFARTRDHGKTWIGLKDQKAGSDIPGVEDSGAPEISVASDGTIYIVWLGNNNRDVKFVKSTDGGDSFSDPMIVAKDIVPLSYPYIESTHGWSHLPGATFRMGTYCTGCTNSSNNVIFAWADYREGISRLYYRRSTDGGNTWEGSPSGQPLLTDDLISDSDEQDFHPQLISTPSGEIGCVFYNFGPKGRSGTPLVWENSLIDVVIAISVDDGQTFSHRITVTDHPWDPAMGAPLSHGDPDVTFLGEYFGLDASTLGFFPLWTDTRTGMQEIFTARVNEIHARLSGRNISIIPSLSEGQEKRKTKGQHE